MSLVNVQQRLGEELAHRGLLPKLCRLIEVSIPPTGALVLRYEVYVQATELGLFADAMKAAADAILADDERNRLARTTPSTV